MENSVKTQISSSPVPHGHRQLCPSGGVTLVLTSTPEWRTVCRLMFPIGNSCFHKPLTPEFWMNNVYQSNCGGHWNGFRSLSRVLSTSWLVHLYSYSAWIRHLWTSFLVSEMDKIIVHHLILKFYLENSGFWWISLIVYNDKNSLCR